MQPSLVRRRVDSIPDSLEGDMSMVDGHLISPEQTSLGATGRHPKPNLFPVWR